MTLQLLVPAVMSPGCSEAGSDLLGACASAAPTIEGWRHQEKCMCTSGTKVLLLPELCLILALWIDPGFFQLFSHTRSTYIILNVSLILLGLCSAGVWICH